MRIDVLVNDHAIRGCCEHCSNTGNDEADEDDVDAVGESKQPFQDKDHGAFGNMEGAEQNDLAQVEILC
jgi:hypothetical protein